MKKACMYLGALYLGFALACFAGLNSLNWHFWAITLPVLVLFNLGAYTKEEN